MRLFLTTLMLLVSSPALSDIWQTSEVTIWQNGKIQYAMQSNSFYGNRRACERSLNVFFRILPNGSIESQPAIDGGVELFYFQSTGYSVSYVHCVKRAIDRIVIT